MRPIYDPQPLEALSKLLESLGKSGDNLIMTAGDDWDTIKAGFYSIVERLPIGALEATTLLPHFQAIQGALFAAYVTGYNRGQREARMPEFVVAPEQEATP